MFDYQQYIDQYLSETVEICKNIDQSEIQKAIEILQDSERIFLIGVGGGAGTGSHVANDFLKIAWIQSVCLSDNVSVLTALTNDEGWNDIFCRQLQMHRMIEKDCLMIFSVGGGTEKASYNIVKAIYYAKDVGAKIIGVVGRDSGATYRKADACILVPQVHPDRVTPHTEDLQMITAHLIANAIKEVR